MNYYNGPDVFLDIKTGNLVLCNLVSLEPLFARDYGSVCLLYKTLEDLKGRRNRIASVAKKHITKVLNKQTCDLDDCPEESEDELKYPMSHSDGPDDSPNFIDDNDEYLFANEAEPDFEYPTDESDIKIMTDMDYGNKTVENEIICTNSVIFNNFRDATLENVKFIVQIMEYNNFTNATVTNSNFTQIKCLENIFRKMKISKSIFDNAKMTMDIFDESILNDVSFIQSTMNGVSFTKTKITNGNFRFANLENVDFSGAILSNVDFSCTTLKNVNFTGATLIGVIFDAASFQSVNMDQIVLGQRKINPVYEKQLAKQDMFCIKSNFYFDEGMIDLNTIDIKQQQFIMDTITNTAKYGTQMDPHGVNILDEYEKWSMQLKNNKPHSDYGGIIGSCGSTGPQPDDPKFYADYSDDEIELTEDDLSDFEFPIASTVQQANLLTGDKLCPVKTHQQISTTVGLLDADDELFSILHDKGHNCFALVGENCYDWCHQEPCCNL